jgi:hypothetical protein
VIAVPFTPVTGLIYVAIIAVWAAVLVPMWLRRHDHANESRNVDRFNTAMRTLSRSRRRGRPSEPRETLQPRRSNDREVVVTGARGRVSDREAPMSASQRRAARGLDAPRRSTSSVAAARRRRTTVLLLGLLAVSAGAAVAGLLPAWALVAPGTLLVAFLILAGRRPAPAAARRPQPVRAPRPVHDETPRRGRRAVDPHPSVPYRQPAVLAPTGTDGLVGTAPMARGADGAWEPVPTTLPTYVNAPRASGIPRILDLTTPGSWTSAAMLERAQAMRTPSDAARDEQDRALAEDPDAEVARYADAPRRRRAVND